MAKTAVMIDGAFYRKRSYHFWGDKTPTARAVEMREYVYKHLKKSDGGAPRHLYRIFYYDCPPLAESVYHPIRGNVNLAKEPTYAWSCEFFEELKRERKLALRMGRISSAGTGFSLNQKPMKKLCSGAIDHTELQTTDFHPTWSQKGVDMKLGLDIASIAYEGTADQIILIAGDSDFVPAAKIARRKGIDFILDPMGAKINNDLLEHIDGMESFITKDPSLLESKF